MPFSRRTLFPLLTCTITSLLGVAGRAPPRASWRVTVTLRDTTIHIHTYARRGMVKRVPMRKRAHTFVAGAVTQRFTCVYLAARSGRHCEWPCGQCAPASPASYTAPSSSVPPPPTVNAHVAQISCNHTSPTSSTPMPPLVPSGAALYLSIEGMVSFEFPVEVSVYSIDIPPRQHRIVPPPPIAVPIQLLMRLSPVHPHLQG